MLSVEKKNIPVVAEIGIGAGVSLLMLCLSLLSIKIPGLLSFFKLPVTLKLYN